MIFVILLGAEVFNAFLALSQMPMQAAEFITAHGLPPYGVLARCSRSTSCWAR